MDSANQSDLQALYRQYREWLVAFLEEQDPIGIVYPGYFKGPEYDLEASWMIALLPQVSTPEELAQKVHRIFVESFDAEMAGQPGDYLSIARAMLDKWREIHADRGL